MADGSRDRCSDPKQMNELTFSAPDSGHGDTKKCSAETIDADKVKLSFYTELVPCESYEKSDSRGVAANLSAADSRKFDANAENGDDRKKRCFDRYDSSESSDSGVAVLSPTESSGCSSSDITEPASPRSPESSCSTTEESASARMPPWASDPASPAPRRIAAQPVPLRRPTQPPVHRCITEYFSHKMKPPNGLKRDANTSINDDTKRKCLPKNGLTPDWENYISYLSQTLSPKVLRDVGKQVETVQKPHSNFYGTSNHTKSNDVSGKVASAGTNSKYEANETSIDNKEKVHTTTSNGFIDIKYACESTSKPTKSFNSFHNGLVDSKKFSDSKTKTSPDPSASGTTNVSAKSISPTKRKIPIPATSDHMRIAANNSSPKKVAAAKPNNMKMNGVVSSTTKLDSRMNGVTCGSNNLSLTPITPNLTTTKKDVQRRSAQTTKRNNRKSSACIANNKNLTWSKVNNLKQVQLQKQNCVNSVHSSTVKNITGDITLSPPKINVPNGVRQVPMNMNGTLNNINVPVTSLQNCHQLNIPQPCNGTVPTNNLASFVTVPQNVMLTALRIPQNGITAQTLNQQGNITGNIAFNRPNVNVSSPTKLNGQFVFPLVQNINGTVVQIPNLMTKMPNFVLPQTSQLTAQTQDHLQNQQAAQILINGTLLKLANTMSSTYSNVNKSMPAANQSIPVLNKNVPGMQTVGMTVQPKPNYTVNLSQPILMPQPGYIVTSVPNITVKETYCYSNTNTGSPTPQTSCSNPIVHHPPPILPNFTTQALHTSSIPIPPVKPPDNNPIQGTEPPSSTVKEPELCEPPISKCDIPWLSKNVNNNIVPLDTNKLSRPFAEVSSLTEKLVKLSEKVIKDKNESERQKLKVQPEETKNENMNEELRKIEEVARREDTIFTQITVLKDVTSNVHSTVIEANFCSATTESSESGIGTDKSIDSPSDSQTSKECDEDSSLSLSISVCSVEVQDSQKSPILKQPKTLRFPPRNPVKTNNNQRKSNGVVAPTATVCLWENCKKKLECDTDLLEHLQNEHVETQAGKENFVCLWEQCKVRGKPSCSRLWLERHALSHGGNKPFKCIVDGCGRRFSTRMLLERHVNNHFNEVSPSASGSKKTTENAPKLIRRNGKKLRYRRQPWSARMFDFFDAGMMEGLAWRLARCTRWRLGGGCPLREPVGRHTFTLHAALTATRYNATEARREALLTYYPPHVIEDEWVPEKEVRRVKRVEISSLPAHTKVMLFEQFSASYRCNGVAKPSPPPPQHPQTPSPVRTLPVRHCNSSRVLNNLIAKQKLRVERSCSATNLPMVYREEERVEVSGAKKRKLGRRHGNTFWPCGR